MTIPTREEVERLADRLEITADDMELPGFVRGDAFKAADMLRSLSARVEEARWQPIETAPKDGTPILVHCKNGASYAVYWSSVKDDKEGLYPCWCVMGGSELARKTSDARTPTHWMPLPSPPKGDAP